LRDYAARNDFVFTLPTTEICFGKSYYALGNLLRQLKNDDHFAAVSILTFPLEDPSIYEKLKSLVEGRGNITFHFPLEGFVGTIRKVTDWREDFLFMRKSSSKNTNKGF
jgi:sporadic carbohydrate cluster protein (TIGR04323 family)